MRANDGSADRTHVERGHFSTRNDVTWYIDEQEDPESLQDGYLTSARCSWRKEYCAVMAARFAVLRDLNGKEDFPGFPLGKREVFVLDFYPTRERIRIRGFLVRLDKFRSTRLISRNEVFFRSVERDGDVTGIGYLDGLRRAFAWFDRKLELKRGYGERTCGMGRKGEGEEYRCENEGRFPAENCDAGHKR